MSNMMVTKNPQNVHRKCFWIILVTFIFDVKTDINMCEPHYVNLFFLWTSSIVYVFDFLTFDIFLTFWHLFNIFFSLNHLSLSQDYFYILEDNAATHYGTSLIQETPSSGRVTLQYQYINYTNSGRHTQLKLEKNRAKNDNPKIMEDPPLKVGDRVMIMNYNSHGLDPKFFGDWKFNLDRQVVVQNPVGDFRTLSMRHVKRAMHEDIIFSMCDLFKPSWKL